MYHVIYRVNKGKYNVLMNGSKNECEMQLRELCTRAASKGYKMASRNFQANISECLPQYTILCYIDGKTGTKVVLYMVDDLAKEEMKSLEYYSKF